MPRYLDFKTQPGPVAKMQILAFRLGIEPATLRTWSDALPAELRRPLLRAWPRVHYLWGGKTDSETLWHFHSTAYSSIRGVAGLIPSRKAKSCIFATGPDWVWKSKYLGTRDFPYLNCWLTMCICTCTWLCTYICTYRRRIHSQQCRLNRSIIRLNCSRSQTKKQVRYNSMWKKNSFGSVEKFVQS